VVAKTVVFVQGGKDKEAGFPWLFFHFHPEKEPAAESIDLAFFDYPAGKLKMWKNLVLKRGKPPTQVPDSETELTPKVKMRLADGTTDDTGPDRPSVLALYDWVKGQPKGSIRSLQVFSHGWMGGPIIWNSSEFDAAGNPMDPLDGRARDAHDTDFRLRDFVGTNPLAGAEGKKFADAFSSDALIKLWGCVAPPGSRQLLRRYVRAPRGTRGAAIRRAALQAYLQQIGTSFPMEMAVRLNLAVWASPLGYGSEPGSKVPTNRASDPPCSAADPDSHCMSVKYRGIFPPDLKKDRWWRVSWFFRNQDGGARFYKDVLKSNMDAIDFVEHRKSWFEDAQRVATAALEEEPIDSPMALQRRLTDQVEALKIV
jgi:hypothetical protein